MQPYFIKIYTNGGGGDKMQGAYHSLNPALLMVHSLALHVITMMKAICIHQLGTCWAGLGWPWEWSSVPSKEGNLYPSVGGMLGRTGLTLGIVISTQQRRQSISISWGHAGQDWVDPGNDHQYPAKIFGLFYFKQIYYS